ncbi:MAG: hypothetical protein O9326_02900 [Microcystis sp. LE19-338.1B]|nr:hypothetical protein [Microcystis sp. LE19-338.1B]MCZ8360748.1 hypothetical protein [Microcystis sp. LE19-388.1G]
MKPVLTGSCQLQVTPEQVAAIEATLKAFAEACDYVNGTVKPNPMEELAIQSLRSTPYTPHPVPTKNFLPQTLVTVLASDCYRVV